MVCSRLRCVSQSAVTSSTIICSLALSSVYRRRLCLLSDNKQQLLHASLTVHTAPDCTVRWHTCTAWRGRWTCSEQHWFINCVGKIKLLYKNVQSMNNPNQLFKFSTCAWDYNTSMILVNVKPETPHYTA